MRVLGWADDACASHYHHKTCPQGSVMALKHGQEECFLPNRKDSVNGWMALAHWTETWATHFRAVTGSQSQHAPNTNSAPATLPYCLVLCGVVRVDVTGGCSILQWLRAVQVLVGW